MRSLFLVIFAVVATICSSVRGEVSPLLSDLFKNAANELVSHIEILDASIPPTEAPTFSPSQLPTYVPTALPTAQPSALPTAEPSAVPTASPTFQPSAIPTASPTRVPTALPTFHPSAVPTASPTRMPTATPSFRPSHAPTLFPTRFPTKVKPQISPVPTIAPTAAVQPVVGFDASFLVNNVYENTLTQNGIYAIRVTIAKVADVDVSNVEYVGYTVMGVNSIRRRLATNYNILVNSRITVPLINYPQYNGNASLAYVSTVNNIQTSIITMDFTTTLQQEAKTYVAYEFLLSDVSTPSTVTTPTVTNPTTPTNGNNYNQSDDSTITDGEIAGIVLGVFFGLLFLAIGFYFVDRYYRQKALEKRGAQQPAQEPTVTYVPHTDPNDLRPYSEDEVVISIEETTPQQLDDVAVKKSASTEVTTRYVPTEGNDADVSLDMVAHKAPIDLNL